MAILSNCILRSNRHVNSQKLKEKVSQHGPINNGLEFFILFVNAKISFPLNNCVHVQLLAVRCAVKKCFFALSNN